VATKRKLSVRDERVKVTARFVEQGSVLQGTKQGRVESFEIDFRVESDEPDDAIADAMALSHQMCFSESALSGRATLSKRHFHNGQPIDLSPVDQV
jgi:hypothetical protein